MLKHLIEDASRNLILQNASNYPSVNAEMQTVNDSAQLENMPFEILHHAMEFLGNQTLGAVSAVSKVFPPICQAIIWKKAAIYVDLRESEELLADDENDANEVFIGIYPARDWNEEDDFIEFFKDHELDIEESWAPPILSTQETDDDSTPWIFEEYGNRLQNTEVLYIRGNIALLMNRVNFESILSSNLKTLAFRIDVDSTEEYQTSMIILQEILESCPSISNLLFETSISWFSDFSNRKIFVETIKKAPNLSSLDFEIYQPIDVHGLGTSIEISEMFVEALLSIKNLKEFAFSSDEPGFRLSNFGCVGNRFSSSLTKLEISKVDVCLKELLELTSHCMFELFSVWEIVDSSLGSEVEQTLERIIANVAPHVKILEFGPSSVENFTENDFPNLHHLNYVFTDRAWEEVIDQLRPLIPRLRRFEVVETESLSSFFNNMENCDFRSLLLELEPSSKLEHINWTIEPDIEIENMEESSVDKDLEFLNSLLAKFPNLKYLQFPDPSFHSNHEFVLMKSYIKANKR
jgi:hypothetical protein